MRISLLLLLTTLLANVNIYAQVNDNFTDGNFTANPSWTGNASDFMVNGALELQLNAPSVTAKSYLSTASTVLDSTTWEFYVRMAFNTSSSNFCKVYLASDQANLNTSLNGYYVAIGGTTVDDVSLTRQTGTSSTTIIDGLDNRINSSTVVVRVKVFRSFSGQWELFVDNTGGTNYVSEGTVTDLTYTSTSYLGVLCDYTSTRSDKFFFDDFNVSGAADILPPNFQSVTVTGANTLDVKFDEPLALTQANLVTNYAANNGLGSPSTAQRDASDPSLVHLTFGSNIIPGLAYVLTISNLADLSGNAITGNVTANFGVGAAPQPGNLVINELHPDPTPVVSLPDAEFVEVFNASGNILQLNGLSLADNQTPIQNFPNRLLFPGEYLVLSSTASAPLLTAFNGIGISNFPALTNSGKDIFILGPTGNVIDFVSYSDSWYNDNVKKNGGWTLERIDASSPCSNVAQNWSASLNPSGGTPGMVNSIAGNFAGPTPNIVSASVVSTDTLRLIFNTQMDAASLATATYQISGGPVVSSVLVDQLRKRTVSLTFSPPLTPGQSYSLTITGATSCSGMSFPVASTVTFGIGAAPATGDLVINELMPDPDPPVGLPNAEYVEIFNRSNKLLQLDGITLTDGTVASPNIGNQILAPGGYLVLTTTAAAPTFPFANVKGISGFPSLTNSGKEIFILGPTGNVIDFISYSDTWYNDNVKKNGGWSLERVDANSPCSDLAQNWSASVNPLGGTPGAINSIAGQLVDNTAPTIISAGTINSNTLRVTFSKPMDVASLTTASYQVSGGINVIAVSPDNVRKRFVDLSLSPALSVGLGYTLTVTGATDCGGNLLQASPLSFGQGISPKFLSLLITELMVDPTPVVGLPEQEYFELYNSSDSLIDLAGLRLVSGSTSYPFSQGTLAAGEYATVVKQENISLYSGFGKVIGLGTFPSFSNTSETVSIYSQKNALVFSVTYSSTWYDSDRKAQGGYSLEMIDVSDPCGTDANWTASTDPKGGTPSKLNSVTASKPDLNDPVLASAVANGTGSITLTFNERVDSTTIANAIITFSNGLTETSRTVVQPQGRQLTVAISPALTVQTTYTVTVNNFSDCAGNLRGSSSASFNLPEPAQDGDIILNEILFNPLTDAGDDFVEIYNRSGRFINLQNWSLANGQVDSQTGEIFPNTIRIICSAPCVIGPGEYRTLTKNGKAIKSTYPAYREATEIFMEMPTYSSTSGTAFLIDPSGKIQERYTYDDDQHFALIDNTKGFSLEKTSFDAPGNDPTFWHSAASTVGGATPGYQNSQYKPKGGSEGGIVIDPVSFAPDQDGFRDFTEIRYSFDGPGRVANIKIYDSYGREIKELARNQLLEVDGVIRWDGLTDDGDKARVGYYIVHFEIFQTNGEVEEFKKTVAVAGRF